MANKVIIKEKTVYPKGTITTSTDGKNTTTTIYKNKTKYDNVFDSANNHNYSTAGLLHYGFVVVFCLLLFIAVFRFMTNSTFEPLTFQSFLDAIDTCPNVVLNNFQLWSITADWGIFNFLRDFFNGIGSLISFGLYFWSLILQIIVVVGHFLTQFFFVPASSV